MWNHFGRIGEYALLYFLSVLIARTLGAEVYGVYALLLGAMQVLLIISSFGLETSVSASFPKLLKDSPQEEVASTLRALLWIRIAGIAILCIVVLALRENIVQFFNVPRLFADILSLLLVYFALRSIVSLFTTVYIARLETKVTSLIGIGFRCLELLGSAFLITAGYGLKEIFILIVLSSFTQTIVILWLLRAFLSGGGRTTSLGDIMSKGWKFWLNSLMEFLLGRQATVLLMSYFFIAPALIGYYDVSLSFAQAVNFGLTTGMFGISIASFATMSSLDEAMVPRYWNFLSRMVILTVVPAFVFAIMFAGIIIPFVYSSQYVSSVLLFQIYGLFLVATRFLGGGIASDYFQATGKTKVLLSASAISGGVNLVLAVILIPQFQAIGAVSAMGAGALLVTGIHAFYIKRLLAVRLPVKEGLTIVIMSVVSAIAVRFIAGNIFDGNVFASLFLYAGLLILFGYLVKPLSDEDAGFLRSMNQKLYSILKVFVSPEKATAGSNENVRHLTDRQKWAYAWMPKSGIVLDVGSSSSPLCRVLVDKSVCTFAVDVDELSLRQLQDEHAPVQPVQASAMQLPFPSGSVDTVLLLDVLEHVRDDRKAIDEAERVLRPGGKLILSVPNKGLFKFLDPQNVRARIDGTLMPARAHRHYSEADLTRLLFLKFRVLEKHYGGLFLYPLTFAADNFVQKHIRRDWNRFFKWLADLDNDVSWGKWSYSVIMLAEKI